MIMCFDRKNADESYLIINRNSSVRKTRDSRDMSNIVLFSSAYVKLVCDFKSF